MRGIQGIIIAVALGVVGAVCNWMYISRKGRDLDKVELVVLKPDAQLNRGDVIREKHLTKVDVPKKHLGNLERVAILWKDRQTVIGFAATRSYSGNEMLFQEHLTTRALSDFSQQLGPDEVARTVAVDSRAFIPEKLNPGNQVSFEVPVISLGGSGSGTSGKGPLSTKIIGPFHVLSVGSRNERYEVRKGAGMSAGAAHSITIRVKMKNGKMEGRAQELFDLVRTSGGRGVEVIIHSSQVTEKK